MPSLDRFRAAFILVWLIVIGPGSGLLGARDAPPVIRVLDARLSESFHDIMRVSAAIRAIVDELERSNLIIHVHGMGLEARPELSGAMNLVHTAGGRRFIRIAVNERLPGDRRAAALAHELYHALEVARAEWVVDSDGLRALYQQIGHESGRDRNVIGYETNAAKRITATILGEIRAAAAVSRCAVRACRARDLPSRQQ